MRSRCGSRQKKAPRLQNGERTSLDHDRRWVDEAVEIAHLNALAAIAGSKADPLLTAADGEGSKRRIADLRVHSKTCNGEGRVQAAHLGELVTVSQDEVRLGFPRALEVRADLPQQPCSTLGVDPRRARVWISTPWAHAVPASRIVVTHARSLILICFPPSVCRSVDGRQRRARAPGHLSPVGAPRAAHLVLLAPTCHRCASRRTSSAKDHAPTDAAPGRRRSDPEFRVASAVAARGRTGNLTALNLHLLFLLRGRRLRRDSPTQARTSIKQVPCPRLQLVPPERKRESLDRLGRDGCMLARLLRGLNQVSLPGLVFHPIFHPASSPAPNAPGPTAGAQACRAAAGGSNTHERGAPTLIPCAEAPSEVIRRHAAGARRKQGRGYTLSGDAPDGCETAIPGRSPGR